MIGPPSGSLVSDAINQIFNVANELRNNAMSLIDNLLGYEPDNIPTASIPDINIPSDDGSSILSDITNRAQNMIDTVRQLLNELKGDLRDTPNYLNSVKSEIDRILGTASPHPPADITLDTTLPNSPHVNLNFEDVDIPEFNVQDVTVSIPNIPPPPIMEEIQEPQLLDINIPAQPSVVLPDAPQSPDGNISDPNVEDLSFSDEAKEIPQELKDKLDMLISGGAEAQINNIEIGLYRRLLRKLELKYKELYNKELENLSKKNFVLPPGFVFERLRRIDVESLQDEIDINIDVSQRISDMIDRNRREGLSGYLDGYKIEANSYSEYKNRELEAFRLRVDRAIRLYEASLRRADYQLSLFKANIDLMNIELQKEMTKIDLYKSSIETARIISGINRDRIDIYRAKLEGLRTKFDVYRSQVEAIAEQIRGELAKVEIYKSKIQAYVAKVDAAKVKQAVIESKVRTESLKVQVYEQEVRALATKIDAEVSKLDAQIKKFSAEVDLFKTKIQSASLLVDLAKIDAQIQNSIREAQARLFSVIGELYRVVLQPLAEVVRARSAWIDANVRAQIAELDAKLKAVLANVDIALKTGDIDLEKLKSATQLTSTMAAAFANALNIGASYSSSSAANYLHYYYETVYRVQQLSA